MIIIVGLTINWNDVNDRPPNAAINMAKRYVSHNELGTKALRAFLYISMVPKSKTDERLFLNN